MRTVDDETGEIVEAGGRRIRPFSSFLLEHRDGVLHEEISAALNELAEAVQRTGRGGSLAVTFKMRPAERLEDVAVLTDEVTLKLPQPDRPAAIVYIDDDHNLSRRNPRQPEIPGLREVEPRSAASEAKEVRA